MEERPVLVRAARLFTPHATSDDALLLRGERIEAVGSFADLGRLAADGAELLDLRPFSVVPGFVDTHVHISGSGSRSAVEDRRAETVDVMLLRCAGNGATTLTEGVTTVRDCGARNDVIFPYRDASQRGILSAPRVLASGSPLTRTAGHGDMWGGEADTPEQVTTHIRRQSRLGADCLKVMVDMGLDGSRRARPGLLMFSAEELGRIVREAADWGLPVIAHCLTLAGIRAAADAGVHSIEHAIFYDAERETHAYNPALVDEIARKNIWVNPGQTFAYEAIATPNPSERFVRNAQMFERRLEDDAKMREAGVRLVSGTDAGTYATPFGRFALAPILFATRIGMSPLEALAASTSAAAEAIGVASQVGELRTGLSADVVAVDGDPESDVHALERVRVVIARGQLVRDNRPAAPVDQH